MIKSTAVITFGFGKGTSKENGHRLSLPFFALALPATAFPCVFYWRPVTATGPGAVTLLRNHRRQARRLLQRGEVVFGMAMGEGQEPCLLGADGDVFRRLDRVEGRQMEDSTLDGLLTWVAEAVMSGLSRLLGTACAALSTHADSACSSEEAWLRGSMSHRLHRWHGSPQEGTELLHQVVRESAQPSEIVRWGVGGFEGRVGWGCSSMTGNLPRMAALPDGVAAPPKWDTFRHG